MSHVVGEFPLEFFEVGSGSATVVFVHGSASDHRTWASQRDVFAQKCRVVTYSRRFHWPNEPAGPDAEYSMSAHVEDLAALISVLGDEPVHLVGHSYGAVVALTLAVRDPSVVRSLVLVEPPVVGLFVSDPPKPFELLRVLVTRPRLGVSLVKFGATGVVPATKAARSDRMDEAVDAFGRAVLGGRAFAGLTEERWEQVRANNIRAEYLSASFDRLDRGDLQRLTTPALVVTGQHSPKLWHHLAGHLDELLPNSQTVDIPGASHIAHEDEPAPFNNSVMGFLQGRSA